MNNVLTPSVNTIILNVFLIIFSLTIVYSVLIILCGGKIFEKAKKNMNSAYIPLINLFTVLEITEMSSFLGILFFIPVANFIILIIMSYKLGDVFGMDFKYKLGLAILPIIFYPLLSKKDLKYKADDELYFKGLDNVKSETVHLLTQDEINNQNDNQEIENNVDSIFKSDIKLNEAPVRYKAQKVDILKEEKNNEVVNHFKPIERIEPTPIKKEKEEVENKKEEIKFVKTSEEEEIEFLDL